MKTISPALAAHLAGGATTLCHCWRLRRRDGATLGFTDHDRDLAFDGLVFEAAAGLTASAVETSAGLAVDNLDVVGALASERLNDGDLAAGLYDDAAIEIWRVNWQAVDERVLMRKGNLGEVSRGATGFSAEVRGLAHRLNQPVGRLFQFTCDADLGDARCGLDIGTLTATGTILAVEENRIFSVSGIESFAEGWFERGRLAFTSGANAGAGMEVKFHAPAPGGGAAIYGLGASAPGGATVELWQPMARDVGVGDTFELTAGCDKLFSTCRDKFSNAVNFRGFPHMPGNDFVVSYASSGEVNDGSGRN